MRRVRTLVAVTAAAVALTAVAAQPASAKPPTQLFFQTADANIACAMVKGFKKKRRHGRFISGAPGEVRCDITQKAWTAPPPTFRCREEYGDSVAVGYHGLGFFVCHGDSVRSPSAPIVVPGQVLVVGRFSCTVLAAGVRCTNALTGHGFELTAPTVSVF